MSPLEQAIVNIKAARAIASAEQEYRPKDDVTCNCWPSDIDDELTLGYINRAIQGGMQAHFQKHTKLKGRVLKLEQDYAKLKAAAIREPEA